MHPHEYYKLFDMEEDLEELEDIPTIRHISKRKVRKGLRKVSENDAQAIQQASEKIDDQLEAHETFNFSYKASRYEGVWLLDSLNGFHDGRWIDDVLRLVKGGKEASVYLCTAGQAAHSSHRMLAAKVYRPRKLRNLRKDHLYREGRADLDIEGRAVLDEGLQHAMRKKTAFGKELLHTSWIGHELKTMEILHAAGVDIPKPYASASNAILMDYIGGPELPAPALNAVELEREEAQRLFERVIYNLERMLSHQRVHGDLSAYNILYWKGKISLIDFPQAINPQENRNAYPIFNRDVRRICEYFTSQGVRSNPAQLARDLWTSYGFPIQPEVHPKLLDDQDDRDREYWQNLHNS